MSLSVGSGNWSKECIYSCQKMKGGVDIFSSAIVCNTAETGAPDITLVQCDNWCKACGGSLPQVETHSCLCFS